MVWAQGGLGNQLFQLSAALYCAKKENSDTVLEFRSLSPRPLDIFAFDFSNFAEVIYFKKGILTSSFKERIARNLIRYVKQYDLQSLILLFDLNIDNISNDFSFIRRISKRIHLLGYFQDLSYAHELKNISKNQNLLLNDPSAWFINKSLEMNELNPIVIHLRRGDYLEHSTTIGVLDFAYYRNALLKMNMHSDNNYWIFTDSHQEGRNLAQFCELSENHTQIIKPPSDSKPAESLLLMSKASKIVISNSTFSWWSAYLARNDAEVIAPSNWFFGLPEPINLFPTSWFREESIWKS